MNGYVLRKHNSCIAHFRCNIFVLTFPSAFVTLRRSVSTRYGESEGEPDKRYGHSLSKGVWAGPIALLALTFMTCAKVAGIAPASMW